MLDYYIVVPRLCHGKAQAAAQAQAAQVAQAQARWESTTLLLYYNMTYYEMIQCKIRSYNVAR